MNLQSIPVENQKEIIYVSRMQENKERWKLLCEQASVEQDPQKLLELVKEINELLRKKQVRLEGKARETNRG